MILRSFIFLLLSSSLVFAPHPAFKARSVKVAPAAGGGPTTPPTFDAASSATPDTTVPTSLTWQHTCTGANGILIVFIGQGRSGTPRTVTGVTYNGDALTQITGFIGTDGNFVHIDGWYRLSPDTGGAFDIVATLNAAGDQMSGGAISFSGAAQSSTFGTAVPASGSGENAATTVSSSTAALVVCATMTDANVITVAEGGTSRFEVENIASDTSHGGSTEAGAASVTVGWTLNDTTGWVISAVSVNGL